MSTGGATVSMTLNGDTTACEAGTTVAELVDELGTSPRGIAVAVNREVVARSAWATTVVRDGDEVEILRAAQGGC